MGDFWSQLLDRVNYLRNEYKQRKINLKQNQGLTVVLNEAEAVAKGDVSQDNPTTDNQKRCAEACDVVWALYDSITLCIKGGLDISSHLRQLTTGTTDFGTPAGTNKTIYFKDFEAELFVAGQLAAAKLPVQFLNDQNDPRGEMHVQGIIIEVKHPNSTKKIDSEMRKFNRELLRSNAFGVFVVAVEDAFCLADQSSFASQEEFCAFKLNKNKQISKFGIKNVRRASSLPKIAALVQTSSYGVVIDDVKQFARYSNSFIFDQRKYPDDVLETVQSIASVFNQNFHRYSQVHHLIVPSA